MWTYELETTGAAATTGLDATTWDVETTGAWATVCTTDGFERTSDEYEYDDWSPE